MAQIGIRLADHSFFPVLNDETPQRKRMILTMAQQGQDSVQVDLVRRSGEGDQSVGCLVLQDLTGGPEMELTLTVGLDADGSLDARISDGTGEQYQSLSVNIHQLDEIESFTLPDSEETDFGFSGVSGIEEEFDDGDPENDFESDFDSSYERGDDEFETGVSPEEDELPEAQPFNPLVLAAILLITLSVAALLTFGAFSLLKSDVQPELRTGLTDLVQTFSALL